MPTSPNGRTAPVTLQTIADRVGVSRTTVSNAYGRPDQLNPALRERILAVADELGYCGPSAAARTLRRGRSGAIGVLFTGVPPGEGLAYAFTDPAAVLLLQGIAEATGEAGVGLLILPASRVPGADAAAVGDAVVDAFVAYSVPDDDPALAAILKRGLPTVVVDAPRRDGVPFVGIDDRAGAHAAAAHLLALGHRRIAVLSDRLGEDRRTGAADVARQRATRDATQRARLQGYADAFAAAGLRWDDVHVEEREFNSSDAGCRGAAALLDRSPRPTAILAMTDVLALGALWAARQRGVRVPETLSVAGFDDIAAAATAVPSLTTIRQPLLEKGRTAGRLILAPRGGGPPPVVVLPTELVVRASTGPVPP